MNGEPTQKKKLKRSSVWVIDERKCLSESEVRRLKKVASQLKRQGVRRRKFNLIRDWFMIEIGLNAGLRVSEMTALQHKDLLIDDQRSSVTVLGKGNKRRAVWISSRFKRICIEYLDYKKFFQFDLSNVPFLFVNSENHPVTKRALQKNFKKILKLVRLPGYYSLHSLRHTYATYLLKASNHNYRFVQQQLGHASIRTTQVYASIIESDGKEALEKLYR